MHLAILQKHQRSLPCCEGMLVPAERSPAHKIMKKTDVLFVFNKSITINIVFFLLFCTVPFATAQYEPAFSQNMFNLLNGNPGFAGTSGRANVVLGNRQQWTGFEGAPITTVLGADATLNVFGRKAGVGIQIMNDEVGFFNNLYMQFSFSRLYFLGDGELGIGVSAGIVNQAFDGTNIYIPESDYHQPDDNAVAQGKVNGTVPDFGLGAFYRGPGWYAGLSVQHLFEPEPNFKDAFSVYVPRTVHATAGYTYAFWERPIELMPSLYLKQSTGSWQVDVNMNVRVREKYWGGLTWRYQDAIVFLAGIELANGIRAGYSYDLTTSKLAKVSNGSHEIVIGYSFDLDFMKRERRYKSVRYL